jgi:hypothetical protein
MMLEKGFCGDSPATKILMTFFNVLPGLAGLN